MTQPAVRTHVPGWCDPERVFLAHARHRAGEPRDGWPDLVWLDAGPDASAGFSYVGLDVEPPLTTWHAVRAAIQTSAPRAGTHHASALGRFALGWVGWRAYDSEACFARVNTVIEFDHARQEVTVVTCTGEDSTQRARALIAEASTSDNHSPVRDNAARPAHGGSWRHTDDEYLANIEACRSEIAAGNAYQLCLTTRHFALHKVHI